MSVLAKTFEDRLALGYHSSGLRMALTYSRDGASRPLAILCAVLRETRHGVYKPDETRSVRLVSELDVAEKTDLSKQRVVDVALQETEPERPFPELSALPDPPAEGEEDMDHVTTDSSSDTEPETVVKPARYARPFLCPEGTTGSIHRKFRTVHLSFEGHFRALLCGRFVSQMHDKVSSPLPFDTPQCRQCFNSKLLTEQR